jgi:DNA repair protein RadC
MNLYLVSEVPAAESKYTCQKVDLCADGSVGKPEDIVTIVEPFLRHKRQEYFLACTLDGSGHVIAIRIVTIGLLNHSLVHPREVFRDAILDSAATMIVVHNHPSGSLEPSSQDIAITQQLVQAGEFMGINVLDHIVVAKHGHCSMKERGLM